MYFKKIETEGLAHYSYMIGDADILCGSGNRATTAAAYLKMKGYDVVVITGGAEMYRNVV